MALRVAYRILLAAFFTYHALAVVTTTLIPSDSALHRSLDSLFRSYLTATGSSQHWNMFTSAPRYHRYRVDLIAVDTQGREHTFGPIFPGLRPYDESHYRHHKVLGGLSMRGSARLLDAYLEKARAAIEAAHPVEVRTLFLRYETDRLRNTRRVRDTGKISYRQVNDSRRRTWQP